LLESAGHALPEDLMQVDELTPFAVQWRYDYFTEATQFDRAKARELIRQLRAHVAQGIRSSAA